MAQARTTDRHLLSTLVCPVTGGILLLSEDRSELISPVGRLAFAIRDGIPIMVASEARELTAEEVDTFKARLTANGPPSRDDDDAS